MGTLTGTIEDREEIRELYAHYAHTIDNRRYDEWLDCFTDEGVFESPRFGKHSGREGCGGSPRSTRTRWAAPSRSIR